MIFGRQVRAAAVVERVHFGLAAFQTDVLLVLLAHGQLFHVHHAQHFQRVFSFLTQQERQEEAQENIQLHKIPRLGFVVHLVFFVLRLPFHCDRIHHTLQLLHTALGAEPLVGERLQVRCFMDHELIQVRADVVELVVLEDLVHFFVKCLSSS